MPLLAPARSHFLHQDLPQRCVVMLTGIAPSAPPRRAEVLACQGRETREKVQSRAKDLRGRAAPAKDPLQEVRGVHALRLRRVPLLPGHGQVRRPGKGQADVRDAAVPAAHAARDGGVRRLRPRRLGPAPRHPRAE